MCLFVHCIYNWISLRQTDSRCNMVERKDAAALGSLTQCFLFKFLLCIVCAGVSYTQASFKTVRIMCLMEIASGFQQSHNIPEDITRTPNSLGVLYELVRKRWRRHSHRKQKRGRRAGLLERLACGPYKLLVLSIFLPNARSVIHKKGELELLDDNNRIQNCCVIIITEPWLHPLIPEAAVQLTG